MWAARSAAQCSPSSIWAGMNRPSRTPRKRGDRVRLARLELHIGNILYRQDRFAEALESYKAAYSEFRKRGEAEDVAIALRNLAVCYISLDVFAQALQTYQEARSYCEQHGMPLLVAEA